MKILYFVVGLLYLPFMAFGKVVELGEIIVDYYNFHKRFKNIKKS